MGKNDKKSKKHKEKKSKHKKRHESSNSSSSNDEWVEKKSESKTDNKCNSSSAEKRDEWMNLTTLGVTYSHKDRRKDTEEAKQKEKLLNKYDPKVSARELNPYWKEGGDGLPSAIKNTKFMKPSEDNSYRDKYSSKRESGWRKRSPRREHQETRDYRKEQISASSSSSSQIIYQSEEIYSTPKDLVKLNPAENNQSEFLSDKEMNDIAAKIVKAEILGNSERVSELNIKLERARELRNTHPTPSDNAEEVLLTLTDAKGYSKPINVTEPDNYNNKRKKKVIGTHDYGKRNKYYPDDDKFSLKNMFENEKFSTADQQNKEFMKTASKISKSDDLDDLFMDNIRKKETDESINKKDRDRAIREHQKMSQSLDSCQKCIQSLAMLKHLMVSLGETVYLSLPQYEPMTEGHCILIPVRHVPCSTQLDENEWAEILDFRKSLTNMFKSEGRSVIFFETVTNIHLYPHMVIHCVPLPEEQGDLAPIYFKKAIDDCEKEWSTNKKLISMAGKDVRRVVPKGLPYFSVSFGMTEGFAHVIEDQRHFPMFFAEEIIGGILDLHHSKWRKSHSQKFDAQKLRVVGFTKNWTKYDCSNKQ